MRSAAIDMTFFPGTLDRRSFLSGAGAAALGSLFAGQAELKIGYHTLTWGTNLAQAIDDIAALSYQGVQIGRADWESNRERADEFKDRLAAKKLSLVCLSSGDMSVKPETEKQEIADRVAMARWVKQVGGLYLQATDNVRTPGYRFNPEDCRRLGKRLTETGKRVLGETGVKLCYHNQMDSLGERRDEVDRILDAADPKFVWILPDVAHMLAAEGDPVRYVRDLLNRIAFVHLKDVLIHQPWSKTLDGSTVRPKYDFVELGQGKLKLPGVVQILKDYRWQGWLLVELDRAPGGRTAKESAALSRKYLEEKLKV